MVLKVKAPNLEFTIPWIESILPNRYKIKRVKLSRYYSLEKAQKLIGPHTFSKLVVSRTAHAFVWRNRVYVHPDAIKILMKSRFKSLIKKERRLRIRP